MAPNILRRLAILGGAFCFAGPLVAADFVSAPIELLDVGFFCPLQTVGTREAPETERGRIDLVDEAARPEFHTTVIPAELGASFGIRYRLVEGAGSRQGRVINIHPPFGNPPSSVDSYWTDMNEDSVSLSIFTFDEDYEIQLGTWTFTIELEGERVLEQTFTVVPPDATRVSVSLCDGPAMMS